MGLASNFRYVLHHSSQLNQGNRKIPQKPKCSARNEPMTWQGREAGCWESLFNFETHLANRLGNLEPVNTNKRMVLRVERSMELFRALNRFALLHITHALTLLKALISSLAWPLIIIILSKPSQIRLLLSLLEREEQRWSSNTTAELCLHAHRHRSQCQSVSQLQL